MTVRKSFKINVGRVPIGGGAPISIQSMTNTPPHEAEQTLAQVLALADAGADIVRLTVPDVEAARVLGFVRERSPVPLVADIHFDYRLAIEAVAAGADGVRINPGNIGSPERIAAVAAACAAKSVPIRVGVNSGSLDKDLLSRFGGPTAEAMVESGRRNLAALEACGFGDVCLSLKSSDVSRTIEANRIAAEAFGCPLHLGVTEVGHGASARLKSAVGIGALLAMGIGDTVRVSLTGDPVAEVAAAREIIAASGRSEAGINIVACPTCGRTRVDLERLLAKAEAALAGITAPRRITVAIMGCAVNGPGEAREADVGLAGGDGELLLFIKGVPAGKYPPDEAIDRLVAEVTRACNSAQK